MLCLVGEEKQGFERCVFQGSACPTRARPCYGTRIVRPAHAISIIRNPGDLSLFKGLQVTAVLLFFFLCGLAETHVSVFFCALNTSTLMKHETLSEHTDTCKLHVFGTQTCAGFCTFKTMTDMFVLPNLFFWPLRNM